MKLYSLPIFMTIKKNKNIYGWCKYAIIIIQINVDKKCNKWKLWKKNQFYLKELFIQYLLSFFF